MAHNIERTRSEFAAWYGSLRLYGGMPAKGTIGGALVVLESLKQDFALDIAHHTAGGGSQVKKVAGGTVAEVLASFGETRPFLSEGGRTNRGLRGDIAALLDALRRTDLASCDVPERNYALGHLQEFLVEKVREWHSHQRLSFEYDPAMATRSIVGELLATARRNNKGGQVAQYLVGAKLHCRLSPQGMQVSNESYSTADAQLDRPGDFVLGNTVVHVTLAPNQNLYAKCARNLANGYRVLVLVHDEVLIGARQNVEQMAPGKIAVESIESYVGQNMDELASFSGASLRVRIRELLDTYNDRVDQAEVDKSVMIDIPPNLG